MDDLVKRIGNVDFEITYACNLRCLHCYNPEYTDKDSLRLNQIKGIIRQVRDAGFEEIHITGGEPCAHKRITDILAYSDGLGFRVLLETNGTRLTMIKDLAPLRNLTIRASIEGPEQVHNIIRRSQKLNAYQSSINSLIRAKQTGLPVQITSSVNHINHASIYELVEGLVSYGLDNIRLRLSMPASHANDHWNILKLNRDEYVRVLEQVEQVHQQFPNIVFNAETIKRTKPSTTPKFFIDPSGMVKPYPFIEHYVGDLRTETVKEVLKKVQIVSYPQDEERKMCSYLNELQMEGE